MAGQDRAQRIRDAMIADHDANAPFEPFQVSAKCDDCGKPIPHKPGKRPKLGADYTQWDGGDGSQTLTFCRDCGAPSDFDPIEEPKPKRAEEE